MQAANCSIRDRKVEQLHFGGGTPTYLGEAELRALIAHLRSAFTFDDSDSREFSIEVDPAHGRQRNDERPC